MSNRTRDTGHHYVPGNAKRKTKEEKERRDQLVASKIRENLLKTIVYRLEPYFHEKMEEAANLYSEVEVDIPQWIEQLTEYIFELRSIASSIDEHHKDATKKNIAGTATGAVGGVLSIAGLIAAPFTVGGSLALTVVGMAAGVAGGVTNITASLSDNDYQQDKQKRVNAIIQQYFKKQKALTNKLQLLNQVIESLVAKHTDNVPNLAFVGVAQGLVNSLSLVSTITSHVTRNALRTFKSVSGVLAGLTVVWDIYSLCKDVEELDKKETEISQMIRNVAKTLEEEKRNFEKVKLQLKGCAVVQKYLKQR